MFQALLEIQNPTASAGKLFQIFLTNSISRNRIAYDLRFILNANMRGLRVLGFCLASTAVLMLNLYRMASPNSIGRGDGDPAWDFDIEPVTQRAWIL